MTVWPIHGGFGGHFMEVWVRFMEVWIRGGFELGAPETAPPLDRHTHTRSLGFRELLKHPTSKDNEGYMDQKLWGIVSIQTRQCPKCEIPEL